MMVLITYDVNTEDAAGRKRLRKIAKECVNYGQRVQNSVFECLLDATQSKQLQYKLLDIMEKTKIAYVFIISATNTKRKLNISAIKKHMMLPVC